METRRAHWIRYLLLYYYQWVDTSIGGILVPEGIIRSVVSASEQIWFIRYIFYRNVVFNHEIIIKKNRWS
jgi:hypothetical protein